MSPEQEVQDAHAHFYAALNSMVNGDVSAMADQWWHDEPVTTMHPTGGCCTGWEQVWVSWEELAAAIPERRVEVTELQIHVVGHVAYTVGVEHVSMLLTEGWVAFDARVTNIFLCKNGVWKMLHHHPDRAPNLQAAVQR